MPGLRHTLTPCCPSMPCCVLRGGCCNLVWHLCVGGAALLHFPTGSVPCESSHSSSLLQPACPSLHPCPWALCPSSSCLFLLPLIYPLSASGSIPGPKEYTPQLSQLSCSPEKGKPRLDHIHSLLPGPFAPLLVPGFRPRASERWRVSRFLAF